jgi:hypothetical protein
MRSSSSMLCARKPFGRRLGRQRVHAQDLQHVRADSSAESSVSRSMSVTPSFLQTVVVADVARARHDGQLREVLRTSCAQATLCSTSSMASTKHARTLGAGRAQQVQPRGVAVEGPPAEAADAFDLLHAVVQHGGAVPLALSRRPTICP